MKTKLKKIREKLENLFRGEEEEDDPIPDSWVTVTEEEPEPRKIKKLKFKRPKKIRIPNLRLFKRVLAGMLAIISCLFSFSAINEVPIFFLFACYLLIMLDYLWKTREKPEIVMWNKDESEL